MSKQLVNILFPSYCLAYGSRFCLPDRIQTLLWRENAELSTDFFGGTIVANCCTDLNQLNATSVLADEGVLLVWVPAWETWAETLQGGVLKLFIYLNSSHLSSLFRMSCKSQSRPQVRNQGNRASSVSDLSQCSAQASHLNCNIHTNDICNGRQEKTHPTRHSDTLILKPTSSFLSVPCFVYCTFFQLGNK